MDVIRPKSSVVTLLGVDSISLKTPHDYTALVSFGT
jgi:hypothetical protein